MIPNWYKKFSSKSLAFWICLASLLILCVSFLMEYAFNIPVCRMCSLERYPYVVATLVTLSLYSLDEKHSFYLGLKYILILTFLMSTSLAFYHIGLEHGWFDLPSFCKGSPLKLETVEALREQILNQTTVIPCNVVSLRVFFLSLAEWNGITSLILLGISWALLKKK